MDPTRSSELDDRLDPDVAAESEDLAAGQRRHLRMADLSEDASGRIRRFVADSTAKGGSSPADVADLYTSPEIVGDEHATAYLDRRYVDGELPEDWRELQDGLESARRSAPAELTGEGLLAKLDERGAAARQARSIFDDPEDLDEEDEDRSEPMTARDPRLADLTEEGRQAIETHVVSEVMGYGLPPSRAMQLREVLDAAGDERSLQYFDLPFERGERPEDWDELRDRALRLRARLESLGRDPSEVYSRTESDQPGLDARELLRLLEERLERGG